MKGVGTKLGFALALLVFGIASGGGVRPISAQVIACGGYNTETCTTDTLKDCTKRTICGVRIGNPIPTLIICCSEWKETTFYTYYPDAQ